MKSSIQSPKTFVIKVDTKDKKDVFLKFKTVFMKDGLKNTFPSITDNQRDASKFVNYDNVKNLASKYMEKYKILNVRVIDEKSGKVFYVKTNQKKEK